MSKADKTLLNVVYFGYKDELVIFTFIDSITNEIEQITLPAVETETIDRMLKKYDITYRELEVNTVKARQDRVRQEKQALFKFYKEAEPEFIESLGIGDTYSFIFDILLGNNQTEDNLFEFKIKLFENDSIQAIDNKELKAKIRKSTTRFDVLKHVISLLEYNQSTNQDLE